MQLSSQVTADGRNYGIDLLRIVSLIMITLLHTLGHGGILRSAGVLSRAYKAAWLLEIGAYCAVNCYGLISGFVGYGRKQRWASLLCLYAQVLFYTVITTALFRVWRPETVTQETVLMAVFPFAYDTYWYFTAYFCLFFFMPFLNALVEKLDRGMLRKMLISAFLIFSVLPTVFHEDIGKAGSGYTFLWLAILYTVGAYIKKYNLHAGKSGYRPILCYLACVLITWLFKMVTETLERGIPVELQHGDYLVSYISPTIVICAIALLLFFADLKCGRKLIPFIRFFAPVSFGAYLLHDEPLIREYLLHDSLTGYLSFRTVKMLPAVIATALLIWLIGSLVDRVRLELFRLLKVSAACEFLGDKISTLFRQPAFEKEC